MLYHLRVKNLALIDSAEVEFGDGLNILTGETGAGKSIIIGSVQIALGGKAPKEMIRRGCDSAYIELVFSIDDERKREQLKEHDVYPDEEGILIISKKITPTRSISRINDETVTAARLREITGLLIDLHGQHEHQSLVNASKHLEILDAYGGEKLLPFKQNTEAAYRLYMQLKQKCTAFASDQETRLREMDFCRFEIEEIENAALKDGEEEKVAADFKRFSNARRIAESLSQAYDAVSGDAMSRAFREIDGAMAFDEGLKGIRDELCDVDSLLSDLSREIAGYMDDMTFDEAAFRETQERLDLIRSLETKYGKTIPEVLQALEEKKARLQELENYDELRERAEKELEQVEAVLKEHSEALSAARKQFAGELVEKIADGLRELNFLDVQFEMEFRRLDHFTAGGIDEPEFLISTNPGEPVRPLGMVASGGELSRIMLAIKTVLAETDQVPTLIFDEIDTGISGRTAQMVSEKLRILSKCRQVICITHLPQIAAMADQHFEIRKSASDGRTATSIRALDREAMVDELARLLGGAEITETVRQNAEEMKKLAKKRKLEV